MSLKIPHITFNAGAFGHTIVGRRAGRWLQGQFDGVGKDAVIFIVRNNRMLLDYLPLDMKIHYKKLGEPYKEMFPSFSNEEIYAWVPDYWREVIESVEGGREWGFRQVVSIREYMVA